MNCPVCSKTMIEADFGNANVDICKNGCKGIWFDWGELNRLDENNEGLGKALEEALLYPRTNDGKRSQLKCPKCSTPMRPHKYKSNKEVNVDECYVCGGFFLDSGELCQIRENFMSEAERNAYVQKLLDDDPDWQEHKEEQKAAKAKVEKAKSRRSAVGQFGNILRTGLFRMGR